MRSDIWAVNSLPIWTVVHDVATLEPKPATIASQAAPMTTSLLASSVLVLAGMLAAGAAGMLTSSIMSHGKRREDLYAGCTLCDGATRRKVPRLEQLARGRFCRPPHDVTPNVPSVAVGSSATQGFPEPRPSSGCALTTGCISSPA